MRNIWTIIEERATTPEGVAKIRKVVDAIEEAATTPAEVADLCRIGAYAGSAPGRFDQVRGTLQLRGDGLAEEAAAAATNPASPANVGATNPASPANVGATNPAAGASSPTGTSASNP
jgi:hypothetical protein